jgi:hypothetical protein
MSSFHLVRLNDLLDILAECAPGFTVDEKKHHYWVRYRGRTFRSLPLGKHGRRFNVEVEFGFVPVPTTLFRVLAVFRRHYDAAICRTELAIDAKRHAKKARPRLADARNNGQPNAVLRRHNCGPDVDVRPTGADVLHQPASLRRRDIAAHPRIDGDIPAGDLGWPSSSHVAREPRRQEGDAGAAEK